MKQVREACLPRSEVLKGDLEDAIFAADFGHVIEGVAAKVYQEPTEFFRNTHPAGPLKNVITTIFGRLAEPNEAGAAVRLSTGFGGGKTHTLIALWHIAKNITSKTLGTELLPAAGRPAKVAVAGVDGDKSGTQVVGSHDDLTTRSLWGELAYQLGGAKAYQKLKSVDSPETVPDSKLIRDMLPKTTPVLILLDELVLYMSKLPEQCQGTVLAFIGSLISEILARPQAVLVITDPADQPAFQKSSLQLAKTVDDLLGRKTSNYEAIGNESAQVINRRLFNKVDGETAQAVSAEYYSAYKRIADENPDGLPTEAATMDYAQHIVECFPFHPRLLETAQDRLGALQDFNRSRGTLRLFARILRDVYGSGSETSLISAGDLNWESDRIQADLLQRLKRDNFRSAVDADVVKHAGQLDTQFSTDLHRRVASALLLESLPLNDNAAMDKRDLAIAVLRPSDIGHEPGEAIDRLMSVCWHTYKDGTGNKFQFRYEPNANKIIEERAASVSYEDAAAAVHALAQNYFKGSVFTLVAYPGSPRAVADDAKLKLVLCDSEELAQSVCNFEDDADPAAKTPRRFRNSILGIAPTGAGLHEAVQAMQRQKAAEEVYEEQKGHKSPLKEQVEDLLPVLRKRAQIRIVRSFNRVVFRGRPSVTLTENYLVPEEGALTGTNGQAQLKKFLDDNKLVYQPNDSLDVDLLVKTIVPGATPSLDHEGAYPASSVHERALAHEKLRLMMNEVPVRNAVLKAVEEGKLVVRLANGEAHDAKGCVAGDAASRKRFEERKLRPVSLTSDVLLAPPSAPCTAAWLQVSEGVEYLSVEAAATMKYTQAPQVERAMREKRIESVEREGERLVVNNEKFQKWQPSWDAGASLATTWDEAIQYASRRPLQRLKLKASTPEVAKELIGLAQPFGAKSLNLSVVASGSLKEGGTINFIAQDLRHNHPMKPLDVAGNLTRAMTEDASFNTELQLGFGDEGLREAGSKLEQARDASSEAVGLEAEFGEEGEPEQ